MESSAREAAAGKGVALLCDLETAMRELSGSEASGILSVRCGESEARFFFSDGRIVGAAARDMTKFGRALVERGRISEAILESALSLQKRKKNPEPLAALLVSLGVVSAYDARQVLREQCFAVFAECRAWSPCKLEFAKGTISTNGIHLVVRVADLLRQAADGRESREGGY